MRALLERFHFRHPLCRPPDCPLHRPRVHRQPQIQRKKGFRCLRCSTYCFELHSSRWQSQDVQSWRDCCIPQLDGLDGFAVSIASLERTSAVFFAPIVYRGVYYNHRRTTLCNRSDRSVRKPLFLPKKLPPPPWNPAAGHELPFRARLFSLLRSRGLSNVLFFYFLAYMSVTSTSFKALDCRTEDPIYGVVYLREDLRVQCYKGVQALAVVFAYLTLLVVGIGFPVTVFLFLFRASAKDLSDPEFRAIYGFLFRGYRRNGFAADASAALSSEKPLANFPDASAATNAVSSRRLQIGLRTVPGKNCDGEEDAPSRVITASTNPMAIQGTTPSLFSPSSDSSSLQTGPEASALVPTCCNLTLQSRAICCRPQNAVCYSTPPSSFARTRPLPQSFLPHAQSASAMLCSCRWLPSGPYRCGHRGAKGHALWWESIVLLRKAGLVMFAVLVSDPFYQSAGATILLFLSFGLQVFVQPYEKALFNNLEALSLSAGIITSVVSSILLQYDVTDPLYLSQQASSMPSGQWLATVILAGINIVVLAIFACLWFWHTWNALSVDMGSKCATGGRFLCPITLKSSPFLVKPIAKSHAAPSFPLHGKEEGAAASIPSPLRAPFRSDSGQEGDARPQVSPAATTPSSAAAAAQADGATTAARRSRVSAMVEVLAPLRTCTQP